MIQARAGRQRSRGAGEQGGDGQRSALGYSPSAIGDRPSACCRCDWGREFRIAGVAAVLAKTPAELRIIANVGYFRARRRPRRKFGFAQATSDYRTIIDDPEISTPFSSPPAITATLVWSSRRCRRANTCLSEKPLALNRGNS